MSDSDSEAFTIEDDKALHPYYKIGKFILILKGCLIKI